NLSIEALPGRGDFFGPFGIAVFREVELELFNSIDQLAQDELRIADHRQVRVHLPSDPGRSWIDLDVFRLVGPGGRLPEMLTAPEPEPDREHHIRAPGERFLGCAANGEGVRFGQDTWPHTRRESGSAGHVAEPFHSGARL